MLKNLEQGIYFFDLIIPCSGQQIIPKGFLQVDNGQIIALGHQSQISAPEDEIKYFSNTIALPAFINGHTHLSYTHNYSSKKSLAWIYELIKESRQYSSEQKTAIIEKNLEQIYRTGTNFIIENTPFLEVVEVLNKQNNVQALIGLEVFGQEEETFEKYLKQINRLKQEFANLNFTFSAHSIYNVGSKLLIKLSEWAQANNKPLLLHLAEFDFELKLTNQGYADQELKSFYEQINFAPPDLRPLKNLSPIQYLKKINCLNSNLVLTHCIKASEDDLNILAEHKVKIVSCPRSNAYLQNGIANLSKMFELGIEVCFGTDGLSSNLDLNLYNEIKFAYLQHRTKVSAKMLWEGITSAPAKAFDLNFSGSLAPQKKANLNLLKITNSQMQKAVNLKQENIYEFLLTLF